MNSLVTGVYRFSKAIIELASKFWLLCKEARAIGWYSNTIAMMFFIGAFEIADGIHVVFLSQHAWYIRWPLYLMILWIANKYSPNSKRIRDVGSMRPIMNLVMKTLMGIVAMSLATIVRITLTGKMAGWTIMVIPIVLIIAAFGFLPYAIRDIKEDLIQEVLTS